jgi:hypothetical protein
LRWNIFWFINYMFVYKCVLVTNIIKRITHVAAWIGRYDFMKFTRKCGTTRWWFYFYTFILLTLSNVNEQQVNKKNSASINCASVDTAISDLLFSFSFYLMIFRQKETTNISTMNRFKRKASVVIRTKRGKKIKLNLACRNFSPSLLHTQNIYERYFLSPRSKSK